jgi:hypothetical protein
MGAVAAVLIGIGIIAIIYGFMMRTRVGRVTDAPFVKTGEAAGKGTGAANAKGAISVEGNVSCQAPLVSPVSGTTCLYYEVKVTAAWKDGDTHKTKEIGTEKRAAQFAVDDGTGPVWVDARDGGDFEPNQIKEETKGTGLIGGITGQDLQFGNYRVSTGMLSLGTKYTVKESVLPAVPKVYVCGKVGSSNEIMKPGWRNLLVTNKSREDYLGHAMAHAKFSFMGGGGGILVGAILGVVASLMGPSDAEVKATAAKAAASASAAIAAAQASADAAAASASAAATAAGAAHPAGGVPGGAHPAAHPAPAGTTAPTAAPAGKAPAGKAPAGKKR